MNNKQRKTLETIFSIPPPADLAWAELESLLLAIGAKKAEGAGSRVRFSLGMNAVIFHRPHNPKTLRPYQISLAKEFLEKASIRP